jgi:hypothetical protein
MPGDTSPGLASIYLDLSIDHRPAAGVTTPSDWLGNATGHWESAMGANESAGQESEPIRGRPADGGAGRELAGTDARAGRPTVPAALLAPSAPAHRMPEGSAQPRGTGRRLGCPAPAAGTA